MTSHTPFFSEVLQCWLFIHFSSYSADAWFWFPIFLGVQVAILIFFKAIELREEKPAETADEREQNKGEELQVAGIGCCKINLALLIASISPLLLALYQQNAPLRSTQYDIVITVFYWINDTTATLETSVMHEKMVKNGIYDQYGQVRQVQMFQMFTLSAALVFYFYTYVLAWSYWVSSDIEEDWNYGYTLFFIIDFTMLFSCLLCACYVHRNGMIALEQSEKPKPDAKSEGDSNPGTEMVSKSAEQSRV